MNQDYTQDEILDIRKILDELIESLRAEKNTEGSRKYEDAQIFDIVNKLEDLFKNKKIKYIKKDNIL